MWLWVFQFLIENTNDRNPIYIWSFGISAWVICGFGFLYYILVDLTYCYLLLIICIGLILLIVLNFYHDLRRRRRFSRIFPIVRFSLVVNQSCCLYKCACILLMFLLYSSTLMMMVTLFLSILLNMLMYNSVDLNNEIII